MEANNESDYSEPELFSNTCLTIKLILLKTEFEIEDGLRLVCLHHKIKMLPFMELFIDHFYLRYDILYDHTMIEGIFDNAILYDLTMWPKTNPDK